MAGAHRLASVFGMILATGLGGFIVLHTNVVFTMSHASLVDQLGQIVFNVIAIFLLVKFSRKPQFRPHQ